MKDLAPQKVAIAEESLRFHIVKCKIASFAAGFAENSPENRRKIAVIFKDERDGGFLWEKAKGPPPRS